MGFWKDQSAPVSLTALKIIPSDIHFFVVEYYLSDITLFKIQYAREGKPVKLAREVASYGS